MKNKSIYSKLITFFSYLIVAILNGYLFNWINDTYFNYSNESENGLKNFSGLGKFVIVVILAPILETLIFQFTPNEILEKLKVRSYFLKITIPSLLFSLAHFYHPIYIVMSFIAGIILNKYYIDTKNETRLFFILTVLLHSAYNLYGYLFVV
ncbi:CPBP family intramembrane metalloprotease [Flavobacterium sp. LS1R47]|uniref:CPBP family intramembrane metalloprotease n=1 Tax=Flavobacterium frigoritolerans TaxID=2987686 RepID=A0A9X2Z018_9FLAO|nr:CPBP family intramembrane glutamic endopeptidase [Flavobacterium frigoritolerans]MCV9932284.1 CPBP family intramembrane metalloprotease [Flavobacterium frigoritolerans]